MFSKSTFRWRLKQINQSDVWLILMAQKVEGSIMEPSTFCAQLIQMVYPAYLTSIIRFTCISFNYI